MLRESKGNMYEFVTHTWNPIKGKCSHDCSYCYMKEFEQKDLRLVEKEFVDLGENKVIFVGSGTDIFAENIKTEWIIKVLEHCDKYPKNTYLFQSKNMRKMLLFKDYFPKKSIIGTTIETNRFYKDIMGDTSTPKVRTISITVFKKNGFKTFVTIEPILKFDFDEFTNMLTFAKPDFVNIGADSKGHNLPEPTAKEIEKLIDELNKNKIKINKKINLERLGVIQ